MLYKVIEYKPAPTDLHVVKSLCGTEPTINIDLMVGPSLYSKGVKPEDLVGKTVNINLKFVYLWMAVDLDIVE